MDLVVPGFGPDQKILTKQLLYWLAPMVILVGFGSLFQSIAHAHSHFLLPALVPVLNNVVIIFFLLFVVPSLGILGLVQGTLIGAALWLLLLPLVGRLLPSDKSVAPVKDTDAIRDLFGGMLPLIILLVVDQISALFQKNIVSDLEPGSIAVLNYAARLEALPVGIFAAAIASVFFPALVDAISREDTLAVDSRFRLGIGAVFFCAVPATIFLMMESRLAVHVLFERGAFDSVATARAADALVLYAAGLAPQCLIVFVNRVYFAAGNTRTPMKIGVLSAVIHVLSCWVFVEYFGYLGIALGTTIYAFVYVLMLFVGLKKVLIVSLMSMLKSIWRSFVGGLVMIIFYFSWSFDHNFWGLLFSIVVGGCVYLIVAFVLREPVLFRRKTLA